MSQPLDYTSYHSEPNQKTLNKAALANRPLSMSTIQSAPMKCDSCSSHIRPASTSVFQMRNGEDALKSQFVSVENKFNSKETPISVVFKKDMSKEKHEINVLTNDPFNEHDADYYIGDYTLLPNHQQKQQVNSAYYTNKKNDDKDDAEKMDIYTNIYVGSITVISLYLVYRLLLK